MDIDDIILEPAHPDCYNRKTGMTKRQILLIALTIMIILMLINLGIIKLNWERN